VPGPQQLGTIPNYKGLNAQSHHQGPLRPQRCGGAAEDALEGGLYRRKRHIKHDDVIAIGWRRTLSDAVLDRGLDGECRVAGQVEALTAAIVSAEFGGSQPKLVRGLAF